MAAAGDAAQARGIFPSLPTPFAADGGIDVDAQRQIVQFAIDAGAHGLVVFGLAGEVQRLTAPEREELLEAIVDATAGRVPVFAGVGAESLAGAVALARSAERMGADAVVVPAPPATADGDALVRYLVGVADSTSLPVMIQDAPQYLGISLGERLVRQVAEAAENIRMVKIEAGPAEMARWVDQIGDRITVWGGDGGIYTLDCLRVGAAGIVPGVDLVDLLVEVYESHAAGDDLLAQERLARLLPMLLFEMQTLDHFNACAKRVLRRRGLAINIHCREPAAPLGQADLALLDAHLEHLALETPWISR